MIYRLFGLIILAVVLLAAGASSSDQLARIEALEQQFLAPCCWAEPIAHHRSEVALQMKAEIARWVSDGRSDREIIEAYKSRYGARILVEPEGARRWWLNVVPWVAAVLGLFFTVLFLLRMYRRQDVPASEPSVRE